MMLKKLVPIGVAIAVIAFVLNSKSDIFNSTKSNDKVDLAANYNEPLKPSKSLLDQSIYASYEQSQVENKGLTFKLYREAYIGFLNLKHAGKIPSASTVLSIADFTQSSKNKRLWIVDLQSNKLLLNTWVAHGKGSGDEIPTKFSNIPNSHQSSLGFYVTGEIYYGKNGRSMKLDGLDKEFNSKVRERYIVLHGAHYVSQDTIQHLGMLGQSEGCPAVAMEISNHVIDLVKNKSVIYIYANSAEYHSEYLNEEIAEKELKLTP